MDQYSDIRAYISNNNIKGIILDFDKTLYFLNVEYISLRKAINSYLSETTGNIITSLKEVIEIKKRSPKIYEKIFQLIKEYEIDGYNNGAPNLKLLQLIGEFKGKIAIYSMNTLPTIKQYLLENDLFDRFNIIYSQETLSMPKPSKAEIEDIIKQWGFKKSDVIFIGNSNDDRQSGVQSGVTTFIIEMNISGVL